MTRISERVGHLGTEAAFVVSAEAEASRYCGGPAELDRWDSLFPPERHVLSVPESDRGFGKKGLTSYEDFRKTFLGNTTILYSSEPRKEVQLSVGHAGRGFY